MAVVTAYIIFVPIAALCFARLPTRTAILMVLIGGWWLLPVGRYGPLPADTSFPWWITGIALPSDMLLTKAWVPPLVALVGAALTDWERLRRWRPRAIDLPMLGWCLWPLVDGVWVSAAPPSWVATLYVLGSWGLPWLIGRVWLAGPENMLALTRALALSGLANLPVAVIEGMRPPMLYELVYGRHPFALPVTSAIGRSAFSSMVRYTGSGQLLPRLLPSGLRFKIATRATDAGSYSQS